MFGIMNPKNNCQIGDCSSLQENYLYHRKHYCGTCKTIGNDYGAYARLLLNYDTVFLAELLSDLAEAQTDEWQDAYQAINKCFQLPDKDGERPLSLRYAAAVNVFLGELKIEDNLQDEAGMKWKLARKTLDGSFRKAGLQLQAFGVDTDYFYRQSEWQKTREKAADTDFESVEAALEYYAETTANMTAAAFAAGTDLMGKPESRASMESLGAAFGRLIYILDALEDLPKDLKKRSFNPLIAYYQLKKDLSQEGRESIIDYLYQLQTELEQHFQSLTLDNARKQVYISRLAMNLSTRIQKIQDREIPVSFARKLRNRWEAAQEKTVEMLCNNQKRPAQWQLQLLALAVFIAPQSVEHPYPAGSSTSFKWWMLLLGAMLSSIFIGLTIKPIQAIFANQGQGKAATPKSKSPKNPPRKKHGWWKRLFPRRKKMCCDDCCDTCMDCLKALLFILLVLAILGLGIMLLVLFFPANATMWMILLFIGIGLLLLYAAYLVIVQLATQSVSLQAALGGLIVVLAIFGIALLSFFFSLVFLQFLWVWLGIIAILVAATFGIAALIDGYLNSEVLSGVLFIALILLLSGLAILGLIVLIAMAPVWAKTLLSVLLALVVIGLYILFQVRC